ncbi:MAG: tRNA (adenosine(37)-N6)-threonylcarbamoyltransferase complex dimerization subunit type 1 TsaB [Desulfosarcinaceae bacterium]|nr:tRNA (adenosine(37)-N6)-threonylcarbamoyltransferase complex dimerization subunit type 1 TsaB [Desulfosarcinaceae bacterium]
MRILAVDTATPCCSVALAASGMVRAAAVEATGVTHSRHLMPLIDRVMAATGWQMTDLDGFGVTRGPGSFTGIRIGMSAVMGLALAVARPVVSISVLEVLAWPLLHSETPVCALVDARRNEVYAGVYRRSDMELVPLMTERVADPKVAVNQAPDACWYVGSGARLYRREIQAAKGKGARFAPTFQQQPDAAVLAWLTDRRLQTHGRSAAEVRPIYLRQSDAQIHRGRASQAATARGRHPYPRS